MDPLNPEAPPVTTTEELTSQDPKTAQRSEDTRSSRDNNDDGGDLTDMLGELRVLLPTAQLLSAFLITQRRTSMNEIKAYVHRNRVADVIAALKNSPAWNSHPSPQHNLTLYIVQGSLVPLDDAERRYSIDLGDEVVSEYKLELHCNDAHADEFVKVIADSARTGQAIAGWIYIMDVQQTQVIQ